MDAVVVPGRSRRLSLAIFPGLFANGFGQVTLEKVQALRSGHQVVWSERYGVLLSGWSFVAAAAALTLLALWSAYEIWRLRTTAWVPLATLWTAITFIGAVHLLGQESVDPVRAMYLLGFAVAGVVFATGVRRAAARLNR
jgi:hypothetical protein